LSTLAVTTDRTPSPVREGNTESGNLESDWLPRRPKFFHLFLWNLALFKVSEFFTFFSSWNLASKCPQHFSFLLFFPQETWHPSIRIFIFSECYSFYNDEPTGSDYWSYQVRDGNTESGNLESDWLPRRPKFCTMAHRNTTLHMMNRPHQQWWLVGE